MKNDLTTGRLSRVIVSFALPFLLSYLLQTLYGMADLFIIGRYNGVESTTAVSVGSQVMHMLTVVIVGLAMGATVLIGRAAGAKRADEAARAIGNTATLFAAISVALTVALTLLVRQVAGLMFTPEAAFEPCVRYLTICFLGIPFITAYNILSAVFRGLGDSKSPMLFVMIACAVNIALDYVFIGAMGMGAAGAALGTTLSQTVSVAAALIAIRRRKSDIALSRRDFVPDRALMADLMRIGAPIAVQDGFIQVSFLVITMIANRRSLDTAAAVGVVEKIIGFFFLIPSTMLSTVSAVAAQNIGANRPDRAKRTLAIAAGIAFGAGLVLSLAMQFVAEPVIGLFVRDPEVVRLGGQYVRAYVWDCMLAGIHFSCSGYFCAIGKSGLSFLHNAISIVCVRIPLAYWAASRFESLFPMGLAPTLGSLLSVIVCLIILYTLAPSRRLKRPRV